MPLNRVKFVFLGRAVLGAFFLFSISTARASIFTGSADLELGAPNLTSPGYSSLSVGCPWGVAVDTAIGRVYAADPCHRRVEWWNNITGLQNGQAPDGVLGQPDLTTTGRGTTATQFFGGPTAIFVDGAGNVWVGEDTRGNNRVLRFPRPTSSGTAANLVLGQPDFTTNTGHSRTFPNPPCASATPTASAFCSPVDVAVDPSGNVWVTDQFNNRALEFSSTTIANWTVGTAAVASVVLGASNLTTRGTGAASASTFSPNVGLAADALGNIWVTDNGRILRFPGPFSAASDGEAANLVLGQGGSFTTNGCNNGGITASSLCNPFKIAFDLSGNLWVADGNGGNSRVVGFTPPFSNGKSASVVFGEPNFISSTTATTTVNFSDVVAGIATDSAGNVWVGDVDNSRILRFAAPTVPSQGQAANLVLGQTDFVSTLYAGAQQLAFPNKAVVDPLSGRLFVDDCNGRTLWWNNAQSLANGQPADGVLGAPNMTSAPPGGVAANTGSCGGLAVDHKGNIWTVDFYNNRVLEYTGSQLVSGANAAVVLGQPDFTSSAPGTSATSLSGPDDVAIDIAGNIWVDDYYNNRLVEFSSASLVNGAAAVAVLGQPDFTSSGAGPATLNQPNFDAVDPAGNVWVSDTGNNRILEFSSASLHAGAAPVLVVGQPNFTSISSGTSASQLNFPFGVAFDFVGNLWIADTGNQRLLEYSASSLTSNNPSAHMVIGQPNFTSKSPNQGLNVVEPNTLNNPVQLSVDSLGNLWAPDGSNNRLLKFQAFNIAAISPASGYAVGATAVTISGADFQAGSSVFLRRGNTTILLSGASILPTSIAGTFNLNGISTGTWDVVVSTGDFSFALPAAFMVQTPATSAIIGPLGGTLSFTTSEGTVTLSVPPGALTQTSTVTLNIPLSFPTAASPAANLTPLGIGLSVTLNPPIEPVFPVILQVSYQAGALGSLNQSQLALARYDSSENVWVPLTSSIDAAHHLISAQTGHLSLFQIMQATPSSTVKTAKAFPNPWRVSQGPAAMTFSPLPANARLRIYTLAGLLVKDLTANAAGIASWDGTNQSGRPAASGFYFVFAQGGGPAGLANPNDLINAGSGNETTFKIAIQR